MREVEDKFDSNWQKIRKRVLQKISVDEEEEEMQGSEEEAFKKEKGDEENKIFDKFQ